MTDPDAPIHAVLAAANAAVPRVRRADGGRMIDAQYVVPTGRPDGWCRCSGDDETGHDRECPVWPVYGGRKIEEPGRVKPNPSCGNCDGRGCMSCVMRAHDHNCENDCPVCCATDYVGEAKRRTLRDVGSVIT